VRIYLLLPFFKKEDGVWNDAFACRYYRLNKGVVPPDAYFLRFEIDKEDGLGGEVTDGAGLELGNALESVSCHIEEEKKVNESLDAKIEEEEKVKDSLDVKMDGNGNGNGWASVGGPLGRAFMRQEMLKLKKC
jgi:hypothetical protein